MKFSIKREKLVEILSEYTNIIKDNSVKPIISGLKIVAKDNIVIFLGTNLEIELVRKTTSNVEIEGEVVFKPFLLLEYIKLLDEDEVVFSLENTYIKVHQAEFSTLDNWDKFPVINEHSGTPLLEIEGGKFIQMLEKVKFSVCQLTDNIGLNCMRVIFKKDELNLAGTDSYRLAFLKENIECLSEKEVSIPLETINILCKLLKDYPENVVVNSVGDNVTVVWKDAYFSTKTIGLPFPDFRKLILGLRDYDKVMEFNRDELKSAIKRAITVAKTSVDARYGALFSFEDKILNISAISGRAKINQKVNMIKKGENFKASLNCKFINEFIENIKNDNIVIQGKSSSSKFEITELNNDNYIYILMPLALRD